MDNAGILVEEREIRINITTQAHHLLLLIRAIFFGYNSLAHNLDMSYS